MSTKRKPTPIQPEELRQILYREIKQALPDYLSLTDLLATQRAQEKLKRIAAAADVIRVIEFGGEASGIHDGLTIWRETEPE